MNNEFEIRSPRWAYIVMIFTVILGGIITVAGIICTIMQVAEEIFVLIFLGVFFLVLGLIGMYAYKKECFMYKGKEYTYIKPFRKSQSAPVHEIDKVVVRTTQGVIMYVYFYDKDGKKLISFADDGTAFKSGEFEDSLEANNITLEIL